MRFVRAAGLAFLGLLTLHGSHAQAGHGGWAIGVNIGGPVYYRPWYPCYGYYYRPYYPYPVYVAPPPVVVQPAPVVQAVSAEPPVYTAPPPVVARASAAEPQQLEAERLLQSLGDPNEQVRIESALQLGRLRAQQAVDPLAASLAGDRSPAVREAAARALGLIGSSKALPALQRAAQADSDRDVRHSAQFAAEVVQTRN
jgi:hypothetical protein